MEEKQYFILVYGVYEVRRTHLKNGDIISNLTSRTNADVVYRTLLNHGGNLAKEHYLLDDRREGVIIVTAPLSRDLDWLATVEF